MLVRAVFFFVVGCAALSALCALSLAEAPGTYVNYQWDPNEAKPSLDMEVDHVWSSIPAGSETDGNGVFASSQYWFVDGPSGETIAGGYMGSQVMKGENGKERRVFIFSCWDSDPKVSGDVKRVGWTTPATCERFGGEGVGSHCILDLDIVQGRLYNFRVAFDGSNATGAFWTGTVTDSVTKEKHRVGTLMMPHVRQNLGFGNLKTTSNEFLEYFLGGGCDTAVHVGVGTFGPFFHNRTVHAISAQPAYNAKSNCTTTLVTGCIPGYGCGSPRVFVQGGRGVVRNNTNSEQLWKKSQQSTASVMLTHYSDAQCPCSARIPDDMKKHFLGNDEWQGMVDFQQFFVGDLSKNVSKCIHGEEECVAQRHFACAQYLSLEGGDDSCPPYSATSKWLDFEACSYGNCTDCAAILGPQCPCATYTTFTNYQSNDIMKLCAEKSGLSWEKVHTCGTSEQGQQLMERSSTQSNADGITYGIDGLAPIFLDGEKIKTKQIIPLTCGPTPEEVKSAVCAKLATKGQRPPACIDRTEMCEVIVGLRPGSPTSEKDLEDAFWAIARPNSDRYAKHMTTDEIVHILGASKDHIAAAKSWLAENGASQLSVSLLEDTVTGKVPCSRVDALGSPPINVDFVLRRKPSGKPNDTLHSKSKEFKSFGSGYTISAQKKAYGIPVDLAAQNETTRQMVWGPGSFGYSPSELENLKNSQVPLLNLEKVLFDTKHHGTPGGDNWGEGNLDVQMITSFGLNITTIVSNTNTSSSTEEGNGFGAAMLDFLTELSSRSTLPHVLSLSLGSLSGYSCDLLCDRVSEMGHTKEACNSFLQEQRQVCMFLTKAQTSRISTALKVLGVRGVSVFGSSGDGGSHFSFEKFSGGGALSDALNEVSCNYTVPVFPTTSPYIVSVGGTSWKGLFVPDPTKPVAWSGSGGGFSWTFDSLSYQEKIVSGYLSAASNATSFPNPGTFNANGRAYPDISAVAVDGTSQSSPIMAGIFSLLTDMRLAKGLPPLGFLGPRIWQIASQFPGEAFEQVLSGNTKTSCETGFSVLPSYVWNPVVGFGRPKFSGMVKHFVDSDAL